MHRQGQWRGRLRRRPCYVPVGPLVEHPAPPLGLRRCAAHRVRAAYWASPWASAAS
jgi:hypothetical protein